MDKLMKYDNLMLIVCTVLNGLCSVRWLVIGGNPFALMIHSFLAGATVSALVFNNLHKKAMKLCDQCQEQTKKAQDLARSALLQSITIMGSQIDSYKKGE